MEVVGSSNYSPYTIRTSSIIREIGDPSFRVCTKTQRKQQTFQMQSRCLVGPDGPQCNVIPQHFMHPSTQPDLDELAHVLRSDLDGCYQLGRASSENEGRMVLSQRQ